MDVFWVILALVLGLAGAAYVYLEQKKVEDEKKKQLLKKKAAEMEAVHLYKNQKKPKAKGKKVDITAEMKKHALESSMLDNTTHPEHPSMLHVFKGHKYGLTAVAYSPNGRFIATSSSDRTIRVYLRDTLQDKVPRVHQITLEYDHATALTFSSDGRTLVAATENGTVKLYQKLKVKPELVSEFSIEHKTDVHSVLMNDIGDWATIITCAGESDTELKFWNSQGTLLQTVNTNQVINYHLVGSKDNRYISVAGYTPEVKIFEITREKNGAFKKVHKIMTLQGHRTGVLDLAFDGSDKIPVNRVVTISKDASVRLWNINVRYNVQEDPKVLKTFNASGDVPFQAVDYSPNGKLLALVRDRSLVFVRTFDNQEIEVIEDAIDDVIKRVIFDPDGKEVVAYGKHAKYAKVFKAPNA
ncbi:TPA: hypothetical protein N0F65_011473 [Lagenidium giganteum]|uniref:Uncharacterized protein n=1 Tax=Lagenidium giganteum TaxID=4803 RepID=A0AAV2ZDD8_9STRA|nr:TPA: hypothetical protein N0F65_011473 [Lagenidium giganteum]